MDLDDITSPIDEQLRLLDRKLDEFLSVDSKLIVDITRHIFSAKGKRLRSAVLFLSAGCFGHDGKIGVYPALAIELIHNATLLHDDVVDESEYRRGKESVNHRWNNLISVLMGDYLFAKAFKILVQADNPVLLNMVSKATERVSIGELEQVQECGNLTISEEKYFKIIADKTASLFSCASECGAVVAGENSGLRRSIGHFGENLGMAFQIADDVLDLTGDTDQLGKSTGSDLNEGWYTLPLIHALRESPEEKRGPVIELLDDDFDPAHMQTVLDFVEEFGGLKYAIEQADRYRSRALESLEGISDGHHKKSLQNLAEFAITRTR